MRQKETLIMLIHGGENFCLDGLTNEEIAGLRLPNEQKIFSQNRKAAKQTRFM